MAQQGCGPQSSIENSAALSALVLDPTLVNTVVMFAAVRNSTNAAATKEQQQQQQHSC